MTVNLCRCCGERLRYHTHLCTEPIWMSTHREGRCWRKVDGWTTLLLVMTAVEEGWGGHLPPAYHAPFSPYIPLLLRLPYLFACAFSYLLRLVSFAYTAHLLLALYLFGPIPHYHSSATTVHPFHLLILPTPHPTACLPCLLFSPGSTFLFSASTPPPAKPLLLLHTYHSSTSNFFCLHIPYLLFTFMPPCHLDFALPAALHFTTTSLYRRCHTYMPGCQLYAALSISFHRATGALAAARFSLRLPHSYALPRDSTHRRCRVAFYLPRHYRFL